MSLKLQHSNNLKDNPIPFNIKDLRNNLTKSDDNINDYLKKHDPSYSYNNNRNIEWNTFNEGIIKILTKTYPIDKPETRKNPNSKTLNTPTKYKILQTDLNYNIFKTNIAIDNLQTLYFERLFFSSWKT